MEKGDMIMADHPDSRSKMFIRSFGIVQEITKAGGTSGSDCIAKMKEMKDKFCGQKTGDKGSGVSQGCCG